MTQLFTAVRQFTRRRFVRDTLILQSGQFALIIVGALTSFVTTRVLGPARLGEYGLIIAMYAVLGTLDLSASGRVALVEISKALGADNPDEVRDNLAYFLRINLQFNGLLVLAFFVFAPLIAQNAYQNAEIGVWARWLGLIELTDVPYGVLSIAYQCRRDMKTLVRLETVKVALSSALIILTLLLGWGIPGLVLSQLAISIGYSLISIVWYAQLTQQDTRFPTWQVIIRRMFSVGVRARFWLGFRIAVDKNLGGFAVQLPVLFLGLVNKQAVGYFEVALKVITLPQPLISGIARNLDTFLPYKAGQSTQSLRDAFTRTTLFTGLIWSGATLGMALVAPIILVVYAGFEYLPAIALMYPLLLQSLAVGFGVGMRSTFRSMDKIQQFIAVQIAALVVVVPIGYVLVNQWEGYGTAWFYGLWYAVMTGLGVGTALWLFRKMPDPR